MVIYINTRSFWIYFLLLLASCSSSPKNREKSVNREVKIVRFQVPEIPLIYTTPEDQARYLVLHYWDQFDFADTSLIHRAEVTEQAFVDFLQYFPYVSSIDVEKGISGMLNKALTVDSSMFAHFTDLYDKYLYHPDSPLLNEEWYIPVLQFILQSSRIHDLDKIRPQYRLEMAMKNRVGQVTTDFMYTLPSGKKDRLSNIHSGYTIIFFHNPDCSACKEVKAKVQASDVVNSLLTSTDGKLKKLVFLAVYPDSDVALWKRHLLEQPKEWTCVYDEGQIITNQRLYDLRVIPTFYLLDREKKVIFKDVSFEKIENYLANID